MLLKTALKNLKLKANPTNSILTIVILLAILLRFYNIPNRYGFGVDAIRDANVAYYASQHLQFPLTGPISSFGPFTFGPFYYYFLLFSYFIFPSLFAPWMIVTFLSIFTVFSMYKIGQVLDGEMLGLILAFFVAISASEISSATGLSNLDFVPLFASLSLLFFIISVKKTNDISFRYPFLFGIFLGISINMHYQSAGLLVLPVILFLYRGIRYYRQMLIFSLGIFLTAIPLLLFNILDHGSTIKGIYISYRYIRPKFYIPNSWTIYLKFFWPTLWAETFGLTSWTGYIFIIFTVAILAWRLVKKHINTSAVLLLIAFFINFLFLRYFWAQRNLVYFLYLQPFIFIFTGLALKTLSKNFLGKYVFLFLIFILGLTMLLNDLPLLQPDGTNTTYILNLQNILNHYPSDNFSIYSCNKNAQNSEGYTYDYMLAYKNRLQNNGMKLGVFGYDNKCYYPPNKDLAIKTTTFSARQVLKIYPSLNYSSVANFNIASNAGLNKTSWGMISPKSIYASVINWW
jgi:hypothetical protein